MKTRYKVNDRVVCLHSGKHGWVSSVSEKNAMSGETLHNITYDRPCKNGVTGAWEMPWSLLRPETFFEYLFMRKGYFGKWSTGEALLIYGFYGIVGYGGVRTMTHFKQPITGIAILAFVALVVVGSIFLHYKNYHGKQA